MKTVATFEVEFFQYLDTEGKPIAELPEFAKDMDIMVDLYKRMVLNRHFDRKAITLQRTGKMGTYAPTMGQEAIGTGLGSVMLETDVYVPYYRDYAAQFCRGIKMEEVYGYWGGDERSCNFAGPKEDFPICVPIATQCLHASGVAAAIKMRKQNRAVGVSIGEGGTSEGDFYEAINVAGAWQLPVVFFINNNQWAISVPASIQTGTQTFAQKGIAAGLPCYQVDGNDIIAVRAVADKAFKRARAGEGATVIEAITYRLCDHTTADDATRYRDADEYNDAWKREPISRLRHYLVSLNAWNEEKEIAYEKEAKAKVEEAVDNYINTKPEAPEAMFDSLFAELPEALVEQRELAKIFGGKKHA